MKKPQPKYKKGESVMYGDKEVKVIPQYWDKEYQEWEYSIPGSLGYVSEFQLKRIKKVRCPKKETISK